MHIRKIVASVVVSSLLWSSTAIAQQRHVADPAALRQAVADQAVTDQENRDAVIGVLQRSPVRELAGRLGLNVTRAEQAVPTLTSAELASLADSVRLADVHLAGGANNNVVISTTTLLLIIIIVILLAR